jgi:NB-ARC domain
MTIQAEPQSSTGQNDLNTLGFSEIRAFVNEALSKIGEKPLTEPQLAVLEGSLHGNTYQTMSDESTFTKTYLQNDVAPLLWKTLSKAFLRNVDKKTFSAVVATLIHGVSQTSRGISEATSIGEPPNIDDFVWRESAQQDLAKLICENRCILIVGAAGVGKSSLVAKVFDQHKMLGNFEYIVFKYCNGSPADDMQDLQQMLGIQKSQEMIPFLRSHRCLICFDEIDLWLSKDYEEAERLIRFCTDMQHNSVFLFTSREPIESIEYLSRKGRSVKTLLIDGLTLAESKLLIKNYYLGRTDVKDLHHKFDGNPMYIRQALSSLALFGDEANTGRDLKTSIVGDLYRENLDSIFSSGKVRVSETERGVLSYLVNLSQSDSIYVGQATDQIVGTGQYSQTEVMAAIKVLVSRSLIKLDISTKSHQIIVPHIVQKYIRLNLNNLFPFQAKDAS